MRVFTEEVAFVVGIPVGTYVVDFLLRWIMVPKDFCLESWCYGFDLSLTALTTGFAFIPDLKNDPHVDGMMMAIVFMAAFGTLPITMGLHKLCIPMLRADAASQKVIGMLLLAGAGNVIGAGGLLVVLCLLIKS